MKPRKTAAKKAGRTERRTRTHSTPRARRTLKRLAAPSRIVRFPQAKGRVVAEVELFIDPSYNGLSLKFQDNSSLSFEFATGFAAEAYLSRWKAGNERVLRYWPRLHSEPVLRRFAERARSGERAGLRQRGKWTIFFPSSPQFHSGLRLLTHHNNRQSVIGTQPSAKTDGENRSHHSRGRRTRGSAKANLRPSGAQLLSAVQRVPCISSP